MTAIETKFIPPTRTKPARIKAFTMSDHSRSVTIGYHSEDNPHHAAAVKLIEKLGWLPFENWTHGDTDTGTVWINASNIIKLV